MTRAKYQRARASVRWTWLFVSISGLAAAFGAAMATVGGHALAAQLLATLAVAELTAQTVWSSYYLEQMRAADRQEG